MANGLPEYQSREQLGQGPAPAVRGIPLSPVPTMPDLSGPAKALSGLGDELTHVAAKLHEGQQHTAASEGLARFVQDNAALKQQYTDDQDYATAPQRFSDEIAQKQRDALANISDPQIRARAALEMTRMATTSGNDVRTAQVARQGNINIAADDTLAQASLNDAVTASSPQERAAAIDRRSANLERMQTAGWINATTAVARQQQFGSQLDQADAMALVSKNPAHAIQALNSPDTFKSLDPVRRESLIISAQSRLDGNTQNEIVQSAAFHPEAASLAIGRVIQPDHAQKIFDNGIVKIESGGDNSAVSDKGALGVSQIMPGTARDTAKALGLNDVAALPDADLKARLLSDPKLNLQLGRAYWQQMVTRYDGNVGLAAAAYNAGPGRADTWKAAATDKFGAGFSPAQLASVVDIKETRDYLGKLYGTFNAPMNAQFSSPAATQQAATAVGAVLAQQTAREAHLLSVQATAGNASDPVADIVKDGFSVDPMRIANFRAQQTAAAQKGDAAAAGRLRDLDFAEKSQPFIAQAKSMPPAMLDDSIKNMDSALRLPGANATQTGVNMLNAFKAVRDDQVKRLDSEPVTLGGGDGGKLYHLQPIDPNAPLDDSMTSVLKIRDAQAQTAHRVYGGSGSPFTAQEAEAWHQKYLEGAPADRAAIVGQFAKGLSPQTFAAALPQIVSGTNAKSDRPGIAMAAGLFSVAPEIAGSILQGIDAQKTDEKYVPTDTNRQTYDTSRASYLPAEAFNVASRTDPKGAFASMQDAIDARYAFLSAQAKDASGNLNTTRLQQATDDVTGGILTHNSAKLIAPVRGMTQSQFDGVLWGVTDQDLAGVQTNSGKAIDAAFLRSSAKLQAVQDGRYILQVNRDNAKPQYASKGGVPFVLDLRGRKPVEVPMDAGGNPFSSTLSPFVAETNRRAS